MALRDLTELKRLSGNLEVMPTTTGTGSIADILKELQGLTITVADGAAADADIVVPGIAMEDTLKSVLVVDFAGSALTDLTAEAAITAADAIQCADTSSASKRVIVIWFNKS